MSETNSTRQISILNLVVLNICITLGVFWKMWDVYGFWWALVYGFFWEIWAGYKFAGYLIGL